MWAPNKWNLVSGEEAKLTLHLFDKNGDPLNIAGATAIKMRIKNADGTYVDRVAEQGVVFGRSMTPLYIYGFHFTAEEVALMPVKAKQSVMVKITTGDGGCYSFIIPDCLNIENIQI